MLLVNVIDRTMREVGIVKHEEYDGVYLTGAELFGFKTLEDAKAFINSLGAFELLDDKSEDDHVNQFYGLISGPYRGVTAVTLLGKEFEDTAF